MKRQFDELVWQEVVWQRPFTLDSVQELLTHLATLAPRGPLVWEARGTGGIIRYFLGAEHRYAKKVEEAFAAHGRIRFFDTPAHIRKAVGTVRQLKISHPSLSLRSDITLSVVRAGLAAMAATSGGEETVLQIVLGPSFAPTPTPSRLPDPHASWLQRITGNVGPASPESRNSVKEKGCNHRFCAAVRVGVSGGIAAASARINNILSALRTLESAGVSIRALPEKAERLDTAHVPWHFPLRLSVKELSSFLLLPIGEEELPGSGGLHPKSLPPPAWYRNPTSAVHDRCFATGGRGSKESRLSISPGDALEHLHIIGPTGCGKSTLLQNLILADIRAGRGVLVIDPKNDLVHDLLARIPASRDEDVVVIDPSDAHPVGFNPLSLKSRQNPDLVADAVLAVFKDIFRESWGVRTQDVLSAALLTLAKIEGTSLLWLPPLLTNEAFRRKITAKVKDKIALGPFWTAFENMKDAERRQEIAPVMNKLRQILLRPGLRGVLGQSSPSFSLADLFHKRRIVLVSLNKGVIGPESARLLGSLIVGLTWTLALNRASDPPERRHIVNVYIDELQDYLSLPTDLADALAQARGLGVGLAMAHQYREQLPPGIRAGIDANARSKIVFGLGSDDAKAMAAMAPELTARDFMALPRYQIYTSFQSGGKSTGWVHGHTLPPTPPLRLPAELKAASMQRYGKAAEEVEREYLEMLGDSADTGLDDFGTGAIGRRKRP